MADVKEKAQNMKSKVQKNLNLIKRGNFLEEREKILGEEKPEIFPKIRQKVEDWNPGQNIGNPVEDTQPSRARTGRTGRRPPRRRPNADVDVDRDRAPSRGQGSQIEQAGESELGIPLH